MNPFFFGSSKSPLYGVYHPPRAGSGPGKAILTCYPMGAEYMRAHRAFRQLTTLLVKSGAHVLRFDYFGTGDSAGDGADASIGRWVEDIGTAIDELKEMAQVQRVTLVGLRLGGTLAALAADGRSDVEQVILWDPIVRGERYAQELVDKHRAEQAARRGRPDAGTAGVHGFPVTAALQAELRQIDLLNWPGAGVSRIDVVTSSAQADAEALVAQLRARAARVAGQVCPSNGKWDESDAFGSALIPQSIIQGVIGCVMDEGVQVA